MHLYLSLSDQESRIIYFPVSTWVYVRKIINPVSFEHKGQAQFTKYEILISQFWKYCKSEKYFKDTTSLSSWFR